MKPCRLKGASKRASGAVLVQVAIEDAACLSLAFSDLVKLVAFGCGKSLRIVGFWVRCANSGPWPSLMTH